ncbi:chromodomain-helicase-DNA-binding protein 6 [Leptonychotes weddellii]|uniref:Chromodomain-helicase-DNA-binding protein 6 n=1 Tax=Leptonychotes weddellii TaxID=9713 RepID=A0A7F8RNC4_LEPWE|nr:chromodomain-helicase-DNA-binding protein 6 [Leptonychotes weddellii]
MIMKIQKKEKQLSNLKVLNHSPMSDASVNFDYKSPSPFDHSTDQEEKIEDVASHCLPQEALYAAEEEAETLFPRKMTSHNGMEDSGGGGTGVKKKRKKKDPGEQEGTAKGSKDREPKPKRKREPREPKEPRKAKEPKRAKEPKEPKQKDGAKKARKPREASGTKEAKEKRSSADSVARTKSKKARLAQVHVLMRVVTDQTWILVVADHSLSTWIIEPPEDDANIIEKILASKTVQEVHPGEPPFDLELFYVKYRNFSYLHCKWATMEELEKDPRIAQKIKRFRNKQAQMKHIFTEPDEDLFNPDYVEVDRVLEVAHTKDAETGEEVTHYLVKWCSLPYEESTWELEEDVDPAKVKEFESLQILPEIKHVERPASDSWQKLEKSREYKNSNQLREYQLEGMNWLLFNWYNRKNCILADEMGLGKTIQSITFLSEIFLRGIHGPFLIIAPLSTITNWEREFRTWTEMNAIVYHGSQISRQMIQQYEMVYRDAQGNPLSGVFKFHVVITTFEMILADCPELKKIHWSCVIIDEAHRLKNRNCKLLEGLKLMALEHKVLLTGTPLQNSVEELFSLLNFLEPSQFPSETAFLEEFGDLKTEEQVKKLQSILKPMMLRRLKDDVEKNLAPKQETIIEVELTNIQKKYYRAILEKNFSFLTKGANQHNMPNLINTMMELRKCCNHPYLINGAEEKILEDFRKTHSPDAPDFQLQAMIQAAGKLVLIDKLLPKLIAGGHKVLIFSQMVRCLDILEDYLIQRRYYLFPLWTMSICFCSVAVKMASFIWRQESLVIDRPRVRKQTKHYNSFEEDELMEFSELDSDSDERPTRSRRLNDKTRRYLRAECFRVEKNLLIFGWGRWKDILTHGRFKWHLNEKDMEMICRALLVYCVKHYKGDEKIKSFIWELITPTKDGQAQTLQNHSGLSAPVPRGRKGKKTKNQLLLPELKNADWLATCNPEVVLHDDGYKKHLKQHCNKVLLRVRMLYYLKAEILGEAAEKAFEGTPARELEVPLPDIDYVEIPVDWWDAEADKSLLIGVFKHGYERYNAMRADPALCFLEKVGMPDEKSLSAEQGVTDGTPDIPDRGNMDKEDNTEDKLDGLQKQMQSLVWMSGFILPFIHVQDTFNCHYPGKYSEEESKSSTSGIAGDLGDDLQEARAPTIAQLLQEKTLFSFSEWPKDRVIINRLDNICHVVLKGKWPSGPQYEPSGTLPPPVLSSSTGSRGSLSEPEATELGFSGGAALVAPIQKETFLAPVFTKDDQKHRRPYEFEVERDAKARSLEQFSATHGHPPIVLNGWHGESAIDLSCTSEGSPGATSPFPVSASTPKIGAIGSLQGALGMDLSGILQAGLIHPVTGQIVNGSLRRDDAATRRRRGRRKHVEGGMDLIFLKEQTLQAGILEVHEDPGQARPNTSHPEGPVAATSAPEPAPAAGSQAEKAIPSKSLLDWLRQQADYSLEVPSFGANFSDKPKQRRPRCKEPGKLDVNSLSGEERVPAVAKEPGLRGFLPENKFNHTLAEPVLRDAGPRRRGRRPRSELLKAPALAADSPSGMGPLFMNGLIAGMDLVGLQNMRNMPGIPLTGLVGLPAGFAAVPAGEESRSTLSMLPMVLPGMAAVPQMFGLGGLLNAPMATACTSTAPAPLSSTTKSGPSAPEKTVEDKPSSHDVKSDTLAEDKPGPGPFSDQSEPAITTSSPVAFNPFLIPGVSPGLIYPSMFLSPGMGMALPAVQQARHSEVTGLESQKRKKKKTKGDSLNPNPEPAPRSEKEPGSDQNCPESRTPGPLDREHAAQAREGGLKDSNSDTN